MLKPVRILVSARHTGLLLVLAAGTVSVGACGQKGPLQLPIGPAAAQRATLPETLRPGGSSAATAAPPAGPASAPRP